MKSEIDRSMTRSHLLHSVEKCMHARNEAGIEPATGRLFLLRMPKQTFGNATVATCMDFPDAASFDGRTLGRLLPLFFYNFV